MTLEFFIPSSLILSMISFGAAYTAAGGLATTTDEVAAVEPTEFVCAIVNVGSKNAYMISTPKSLRLNILMSPENTESSVG